MYDIIFNSQGQPYLQVILIVHYNLLMTLRDIDTTINNGIIISVDCRLTFIHVPIPDRIIYVSSLNQNIAQ